MGWDVTKVGAGKRNSGSEGSGEAADREFRKAVERHGGRSEDQAAPLTVKSAESERNNFRAFLHRHWAGPPDSPVYYVESSKGQSEDVRGVDKASHIRACVKEGLNHTKKPLHGNPDDQLRNETNPCELGGQWFRGTGPRHQPFHDGDPAWRS